MSSPYSAVDARNPNHLPCPVSSGAYSVVRSRTTFSFATKTDGTRYVLTFGEHTNNNVVNSVTPYLCTHGSGTAVPGTTESYVVDPLVGGATLGDKQLSLHALTVVVACTSAPTAAQGMFYMGSLASKIDRLQYATWDAMGIAMIGRREMRPITAYESLADTEKNSTFCAYPMDPIQWQAFFTTTANDTGSNINLTDSLTPIVAVFEGTTAAVLYSVTIYAEWRVIYNRDLTLASTQSIYPTSSSAAWEAIRNAVSSDNGKASWYDLRHPPLGTGGAMATGAISGALTAAAAPAAAAVVGQGVATMRRFFRRRRGELR